MTGSYDSKVGNAPDKVSETNTQPTEAVAPMQQEVAKVPPAEQKSIIDEGRGANKPVPSDFKSKDGTDASVNKAAGADSQAGTGKPESSKQEEVISKTYEKHVESTLGNDTKGVVSSTVTTETTTKPADMVNQAQSDSKNLSKMVSEAAAMGVAGDNNAQDKANNNSGNDANNADTVVQQAKAGDQAAREKAVQQGLMNPEEVKSKEAGSDKENPEAKGDDQKNEPQAAEDVNNKKSSLMAKGISEEAAAVIATSQVEGDVAPNKRKR